MLFGFKNEQGAARRHISSLCSSILTQKLTNRILHIQLRGNAAPASSVCSCFTRFPEGITSPQTRISLMAQSTPFLKRSSSQGSTFTCDHRYRPRPFPPAGLTSFALSTFLELQLFLSLSFFKCLSNVTSAEPRPQMGHHQKVEAIDSIFAMSKRRSASLSQMPT